MLAPLDCAGFDVMMLPVSVTFPGQTQRPPLPSSLSVIFATMIAGEVQRADRGFREKKIEHKRTKSRCSSAAAETTAAFENLAVGSFLEYSCQKNSILRIGRQYLISLPTMKLRNHNRS